MTPLLDEVAANVVFSMPDGRVENAKLSDKTFYSGEIRNGMLQGKGTLTTAKDIYIGEFVNNMREGRGNFTTTVHPHPLGIKEYDGTWKRNEYSGDGTIMWTSGDTYSGSFLHGKPDGPSGHYIFADGRVYKGSFENGKRHGRGRLTQLNGEYYEGDFSFNTMTGQGFAWYAGGKRTFVGTWLQGKKMKGKMTFKDTGVMYDGEWFSEKPHGQGEMIFATGDHYVGDFVAGKLHGTGTMTYASQGGKVFTGTFQHGQPHGRGRISTPGGAGPVDGWFQNGRQLPASSVEAIRQVEREAAALAAGANGRAASATAKRAAEAEPATGDENAHVEDSADAENQAKTQEREQAIALSLSVPKLPGMQPVEPDVSGSCSRPSRKEQAEIRAVSASVIAGTAHDGCKGWLEKFSIGRSRFGRNNWRLRYFVLASLGKIVSLSYYSDDLCREPVRILRLDPNDTRIVTRPSTRTHKKAVNLGRDICIIYVEKDVEYKLLLRTDSEEEHDYWCDTLRRHFSNIDYPTDFPEVTTLRNRNEMEDM